MFIQNADASPASDTTGQAPAVMADANPSPDANPAGSSAADITDAKPGAPETLLDVVRSVVEKPAAQEVSSTSEAEPEKAAVDTVAQAPDADDSDADVPFHTHPRWKQRTEELKALRTERDTLSEPAGHYQAITSFMDLHGLQPTEVAEGFEVMALLKSGKADDLKRVLDWMEPNVSRLREQLGEVLPEDLRLKVEDGLVDHDVATELAQARARTTLTVEQEARRAQDAERATAAADVQARGTAMVTAVSGWEERIKATDPDYAKKAALVETHALAIAQRTGKPPATAQDAIALVEAAYAEVNNVFKTMLPSRRPVTPPPASMSARVTTEPQTLRQAIDQRLAAIRA